MRSIERVVVLGTFVASVAAGVGGTASRAVAQDVDSLFAEAVSAHNSGDVAVAEALYTRVVALDSTHVDAIWNRALLLDDFASSLPVFERLTTLAPDFGSAWGALGWSLILNKQWSDAIEPTRTAVALEPGTFSWPLNLGHAFLLLGITDSSLRDVRSGTGPDDAT